MVYFLIVVALGLANIVKVKETFSGPVLAELYKAPMYTKQDTYGKFNSSITATCKWY